MSIKYFLAQESLKDFSKNKECLTHYQIAWYLDKILVILFEDNLKEILDSIGPETLKAAMEILIEQPEWLGFKYQHIPYSSMYRESKEELIEQIEQRVKELKELVEQNNE